MASRRSSRGRRGSKGDKGAGKKCSSPVPSRSRSLGRGEEDEALALPLPPPSLKREKRAPATQEVPLSTPGREHVSMKQRICKSILGEIKAVSPKLICRTNEEDWWQGIFSTTLPNKQRVTLRTTKDIWEGKQVDVVMLQLRDKITNKAREQGLDLELIQNDLCMTHTVPWEKAWLSFECQVLQEQLTMNKFSSAASLGHKSKEEAKKNKDWSVGTDYINSSLKHKAKSRVLSELEIVTGKELAKAESVLSSIVSGLKKESDFNELCTLSDTTQKDLRAIQSCFLSAQKIIGKMTKSMNVTSAKILTGVTAVLLPPACLEKGNDMSRKNFCNLLSINRQSKYFESAIDNRKV